MIDKDTKMIILNNPNNPTSKVMDAETLDGIVEIANKKGVTILSDEVYGTIASLKPKASWNTTVTKHIFSPTGFSKTFSMTGWRIGYIVANKRICRQHNKTQPNHHQQRSRIYSRSSIKSTRTAKTACHKNKRRIRRTSKNGKQNFGKSRFLLHKA